MDIRFEEMFEELKEKAYSLYYDENGIQDLINQAKIKIQENETLSKIQDDLLTTIDMVVDWKDGNYKNISKESIVIAIACLLFLVSPIDFIKNLKFLGNITALGILLKVIKDEIEEYRAWCGSNAKPANVIEIPRTIKIR